MTNKLNKKILYPVIFLILSAGSFLSWFSWTRFVEELSPINDLNWFMVQNFNWSFTTSDIFLFLPLILGAISFFLGIYFAIKNTEQIFGYKKSKLSVGGLCFVASSFLLVISAFLLELLEYVQ